MILHKYLNHYGLNVLRDYELKANTPTKFNDPFECLPRDVGQWTIGKAKKKINDKYSKRVIYESINMAGLNISWKEFHKRMKSERNNFAKIFIDYEKNTNWSRFLGMKQKADEILRIICFSSSKTDDMDQILLWTHYSNNHQGMRFHFDDSILVQNPKGIKKVIYKEKRADFDPTNDSLSAPSLEQLQLMLYTKSKAWKYENEYRLFVFPLDCITKIKKDNEHYFLKFDPKSLIRIDVGLNIPESLLNKILTQLKKKQNSHIQLFKATLNPDEYKFDYVPIN